MLQHVKQIKGFTIGARDGDIGGLEYCLFDDETWLVRFLVVDTASWLFGRRVLIPPAAVERLDRAGKRVLVALTKEQVEGSPDVDSQKPVSRQREADLLGHFNLPATAAGFGLPGPYASPVPVARRQANESGDRHLRSTKEVSGYSLQAIDGDLGHVEDFVVEDEAWAIGYLVAARRSWWPGKRVLIPPGWVDHISWDERGVLVSLLKRAVVTAPEYDASVPISLEYEERLARHFEKPANWR